MGVLSVILRLMGPGPWRLLTPGWPPPGGRNPKPGGRGPGNGEPRPPRLGGNPGVRRVNEISQIFHNNDKNLVAGLTEFAEQTTCAVSG